MGEILTAWQLIQFHEGCILQAKYDAKGMNVIGWGHDVPPDGPTECTQEQADDWFYEDYGVAVVGAQAALGVGSFSVLNQPRKAALIDMAFELGERGLSGFHKMLSAIRAADWVTAKAEALNSDWAKQVPARAAMDAEILLTGAWP